MLSLLYNIYEHYYNLLLLMQSENYTICDDLGGFGYEIPQETQR